MNPMPFSNRLNGGQSLYLDLVRGMAAMAVLFGHASLMFLEDGLLSKLAIQKIGVLVFFLLSGFLISYSVFQKHREPGYGFRDFFLDRFARIYATYLPALVFVWLVDRETAKFSVILTPERLEIIPWISAFADNMNLPTWFGNLFMLQDFPLFQVARRLGLPENRWFFDEYGTGSPFWTISIEWWIYMLFGAIAVWRIKLRQPFKLWHWPLLAFVAIVPFYYFVGGIDNCLTLLWMVGMGMSLLFLNFPAILIRFNLVPTGRHRMLACLGIGLFGLLSMLGRLIMLKFNADRIEFTELQFGLFLALALFAFMMAAAALPTVPLLITRLVKFVADYSFSLYLTHSTILTYIYLRWPGHDHDPHFFWFGVIASNLVAIIFWWLFERHYRALGKLLKRLTARQAVASKAIP